MAAYETWAGGKVGSGPSATSWSTKPRGGYVPLADIPNAPQNVEMPMPKYPDVDITKFDYLKTEVPGGLKSLGKLAEQKPLPGAFEEAASMRTAAAGKGQMAWGKAIEEAGEATTKALTQVSTTLAKVQGDAVRSQDQTDKVKYELMEDRYKADVDNITRTVPPDQQGAEIEKLNKQYSVEASKYGVLPDTKNVLNAKWESTKYWGEIHAKTQAAVNTLTNNAEFHKQNIENNRAKGDYQHNEASYSYMLEQGLWNKDQVNLEKEKDKLLFSQDNYNTAMQTNPRAAMEESKKAMETGKSTDFPHLNAHNAATAYVQAREATNGKDREAMTTISNEMASGKLMDEKQILARGKELGLGDADSKQMVDQARRWGEEEKRLADQNMVLEPAKMVEAKKRVMGYDAAGDADQKIYRDNVAFINSNIPPSQRGPLMERLNSKNLKDDEKKTPEAKAREREADNLGLEVKAIGDKGYQFKDPKKRSAYNEADKQLKEGKRELTPAQWAIWREGNQWTEDKLNEIESERAKEPDFAPGELRKKVREKLSPEIQAGIGTSDPAPPPRGTVSSATAPTREQLSTAPATLPSQWVASPPRVTGRGQESASFQKVMGGPGQTYTANRVTAYTPGKGPQAMEGKNETKDRPGEPAYTMEGYQRGTFPYVSAAVDENSELRGKYFVSPDYPNVVFKAEDIGPAFRGKGTTAFDVAFEDPDKQVNYGRDNVTIKVIGEQEALGVSGATRRTNTEAFVKAGGSDPMFMAKIEALHQRFPNFTIKSGFRDPAHNKKVGGAEDSEHTRGDAVDISVAGWPKTERLALMKQASDMGILGIGVYENSIHLDMGAKYGRRAWGPSHYYPSIPDWAKGFVDNYHLRKGRGGA